MMEKGPKPNNYKLNGLSFKEISAILHEDGEQYTDEEVIEIAEFLDKLADIAIDSLERKENSISN